MLENEDNYKFVTDKTQAKIGDRFYHYYPIKSDSLSEKNYPLNCVMNDSVSLSKPSSFDDPYDSRIILDEEKVKKIVLPTLLAHIGYPLGETTDLAIQKTLQQALESSNFIPVKGSESEKDFYGLLLNDYSIFKQMHQPFGLFYDKFCKELMNNIKVAEKVIGICCFTKSQYNQRMWSEYADSHRGICVEYTIQSEKDAQRILPLYYDEEKPVLSDDFISLSAMMESIPENLIEEMVRKTMRTKSSCWNDQNEWRIIRLLNRKERQQDHLIIPFGKVTKVYLGSCMSPYEREYVIACCQNHHVPWEEMKLTEESYQMSFVSQTKIHELQRSENLVHSMIEQILSDSGMAMNYAIDSAFLNENASLLVKNNHLLIINLNESLKVLGDVSRIQNLKTEILELIKE